MRLLLGALLLPVLALAQPPPDDPMLVGAAVRERPDWDGAAERVTDVVPLLRYYGPRWFARTTQGMLEAGYRDRLAPDFYAGAQVAYEAGHRDFGAGASAGLHLEWDQRIGPLPVTFLIRARQHLESARGGQADLRATAGVLQRGGLGAAVFGQATWGTENAQRSRFGAPRSGLMFVAVGVHGAYDLSRHWLLIASIERRTLYDDAAESPVTERVSNYYGVAGIAYRGWR
jgi:outer membrane scaffolding protein for murein synthesis (MipA/OmpV family)